MHKLCGMVAAFSSAAGEVAAEIENLAIQGDLEGCRPLVGRFGEMARRLIPQVERLSLDNLRQHVSSGV